ncbi:MAG: hypothetical protein K2I79_03215, partial [Clostridia bacterium]|nr:hypothetical protein [Clostridia bacterium]
MLTLCYVFGFKRIAVTALCVNSALGGAIILICMLCGVSVPGWLIALIGLLGPIAAVILIF